MGQIQYSRSTLMTSTSTGMLFFQLKLPSCFLRIAYSQMNGVLLEFSKAEDGFTTQFIAQSHIMLFRRPLNYQQQQEQNMLAK
ncbi:hypothetical protein DH2020_021112 [Rehmannia glutinosa]|uniref:Uncharacterized protein n=1 Tax=Rehmannia glutinosa TaxID=99300 RepID=A0ABR0WA62_REHGL